MTANQLKEYFNNTFSHGLLDNWPETFEVDAETYANCCQAVFDNKTSLDKEYYKYGWFGRIAFGHNNGIMFRNVELILKKT